MLLFIFDNEESPVRKLLDGGWLIDAGQGQEHENVVQRHDDQYLLQQAFWISGILR
jgi:hypothetical protein